MPPLAQGCRAARCSTQLWCTHPGVRGTAAATRPATADVFQAPTIPRVTAIARDVTTTAELPRHGGRLAKASNQHLPRLQLAADLWSCSGYIRATGLLSRHPHLLVSCSSTYSVFIWHLVPIGDWLQILRFARELAVSVPS